MASVQIPFGNLFNKILANIFTPLRVSWAKPKDLSPATGLIQSRWWVRNPKTPWCVSSRITSLVAYYWKSCVGTRNLAFIYYGHEPGRRTRILAGEVHFNYTLKQGLTFEKMSPDKIKESLYSAIHWLMTTACCNRRIIIVIGITIVITSRGCNRRVVWIVCIIIIVPVLCTSDKYKC